MIPQKILQKTHRTARKSRIGGIAPVELINPFDGFELNFELFARQKSDIKQNVTAALDRRLFNLNLMKCIEDSWMGSLDQRNLLWSAFGDCQDISACDV